MCLSFLTTAAVSSLAKFGAACEDLTASVLVLMERCLLDNDDEVRDRALLYHEVLKQKQKALSSSYILNRKSIPSVLVCAVTSDPPLVSSSQCVCGWSGEGSDAVL